MNINDRLTRLATGALLIGGVALAGLGIVAGAAQVDYGMLADGSGATSVTVRQPQSPGVRVGFDPQPEPPGTRGGFDPKPEPPAKKVTAIG